MNDPFKQQEPDLLLSTRLLRLSVYFAVSVLVIGMFVLVGWQSNIGFLKRPAPSHAAMNPITALGFLLTASSLLLLLPSGSNPFLKFLPDKKKRVTGTILAVLVLLTGVLKIAGTLSAFHFSIDQLLFARKLIPNARGSLSSQMTLTSACCFILSGTSLLLLNVKTLKNRIPGQYPALMIGLLALFSMVGYLYRVQTFYGLFEYVPMAIHTATAFLLISLSLLFAHPGQGIMQPFTSKYTGGLTARRLLPLVILLPVLLGYLRLWAYWKGAFSTEFGVTLLVLSIVLIFMTLIWYNAGLLNKRDVVKQESEKTLLESERRYHLLVSSVKDYAILMLDPSGYVISWNEGAEHIKGYRAEEIIGRHVSVFYTNNDIALGEPARSLASSLEKGSYESEGWRVRKDGSLFWANIVITPLFDEEGQLLLGFAKVTRDITERKRTQEQISQMARLMEDTSDAIFSTDASFFVSNWNKAAEQLFGYSQAEVKGKAAGDVLRTRLDSDTRQGIRAELIRSNYWKGEIE
ncbi:MAG TPA: PAS domain S-box protein, partial [Puia sp.]|nr:PAS domain S-box protein [Puia sp.]